MQTLDNAHLYARLNGGEHLEVTVDRGNRAAGQTDLIGLKVGTDELRAELVVAANQPIETKSTITKWDLDRYFQSIYLDCEMNDSKPSHMFYQTILNDLCCNPEDVAMVGDRIDNDIIPAKEMGLATILIDPKPPYIFDDVIPMKWQDKYYDIHEKIYNNTQKERKDIADYTASSLKMFSELYCSCDM